MKKYISASIAAFVLILSATMLSLIMISLADLLSQDIYAGSESEYATTDLNDK
jgi:hypothetical protein